MNLEQEVMAEMKEAMKSKNEGALRGLRAIKAEIIKAKTEPGANGELTEEAAARMLRRSPRHQSLLWLDNPNSLTGPVLLPRWMSRLQN